MRCAIIGTTIPAAWMQKRPGDGHSCCLLSGDPSPLRQTAHSSLDPAEFRSSQKLWESNKGVVAYVFICLHMSSYVFICLHMSSYVFICLHTGFFKKNSHLMLAILQHFRNPRAPNFKVVLLTCAGKASKKNSHLCFSRVQHTSNIDKRGAGGTLVMVRLITSDGCFF